MSWFGLGGGSKPNKEEKVESTQKYDNFDTNSSTSSFATSSPAAGAQSQFEDILMEEQKKVFAQAIIFNLADISFEKCVKKPSTSLSAIEKSCITSVCSKYLESSQFIALWLGPILESQLKQHQQQEQH